MKKLTLAISVALASNAALAIDDLSAYVNSEYSDNQSVVITHNTHASNVVIDQATDNTAVVDLKNGSLQSVKVDQDGANNTAFVKADGAFSVGNTVGITQKAGYAGSLSGTKNEASVNLRSSSTNTVEINQDFANRADVDLISSDGNKVTIDQTWANKGGPLRSKAKVDLRNNSDINTITIDQSSYNLADVALRTSSFNTITIEQQFKNSADIDMVGSNANTLKIAQNSTPDYAKGDIANNTVKADLRFSSGNNIDVNQSNTRNDVDLDLDFSSVNAIDIDQVGDNSMAKVTLNGSFGNFVSNMNGTAGISIQQTGNDYANVSMTNSSFNAVSINQQ